MKKYILIAVIMFFTLLQTKAQQEKKEIAPENYMLSKTNTLPLDNVFNKLATTPVFTGPVKDYDYYMHKKKNNLTAGAITLGAGLVLSGIGIIAATNSNSIDNDATAAVFLIAGAASGIASIPLMIISFVYGHKAKLELGNQKTGLGVPRNAGKYITGITLKMPIGK